MIKNPFFKIGSIVDNDQPCQLADWTLGPHTYHQQCPKAFVAFYATDASLTQTNVDLRNVPSITVFYSTTAIHIDPAILLYINEELITCDANSSSAESFLIPEHLQIENVTIKIIPNFNPTKSGTLYIWGLTSDYCNFTYTPEEVCTNYPVQFTDTSSITFTTWNWNFGDGTTSTERNPSHIYTSPAIYTVSLTGSNSDVTFTSSKEINTTNCGELACDFTWEPEIPRIDPASNGAPVTFTSLHNTNIVSWSWIISDNPTGISLTTDPELYHIFNTPGTYDIKLTVSDSFKTNSITKTITILPPTLIADFTCPEKIQKNKQFTCINKSVNATSYSWIFELGAISTEVNPTYAYSIVGTKSITLTATNAYESATCTKNIIVTGDIFIPPIVFTWSNFVPITPYIQLCDGLWNQSGGVGWPHEYFGPFTFNWNGTGSLILSGSQDGTQPLHVDDCFRLTVTNAENQTNTYEDLGPAHTRDPIDVTYLFTGGINTINYETWSSLCCYYTRGPAYITQIQYSPVATGTAIYTIDPILFGYQSTDNYELRLHIKSSKLLNYSDHRVTIILKFDTHPDIVYHIAGGSANPLWSETSIVLPSGANLSGFEIRANITADVYIDNISFWNAAEGYLYDYNYNDFDFEGYLGHTYPNPYAHWETFTGCASISAEAAETGTRGLLFAFNP
ncbi:MAG: PKD domain protein [Bacteroidetes bacterium ADurb.Bin302]|nr:MAG: PKD domain protein [Bacteroidetes bacterium ADurb.Bin302]